MAEEGLTLPPDEELFEQPTDSAMQPAASQEPNDQEMVQQMDEPNAEVEQLPVEEPMPESAPRSSAREGEMSIPDEILEPSYSTQPHPEHHPEPQQFFDSPDAPVPRGPVFQPAAYVPPNYVSPQQRAPASNSYSESISDDTQRSVTNDAGTNGQSNVQSHEANENTVWIDSDSDNDGEEAILRQNFFLPYSDHNYDPPDPTERVIHPQEGPFPIIDGLDEAGNIRKQWMPEGYGPRRPMTPTPSPSNSPSRQHPAQQEQLQMQPNHRQGLQAVRPMFVAQPFSMGGTQIDYPDRAVPRGQAAARGDHQPNFRIANEYGNGMTAHQSNRINNSRPVPGTATVMRSGHALYQSPQNPNLGVRNNLPQRRGPLPPNAAPLPGSYQHIGHPSPMGAASGVRRIIPGRPLPPPAVSVGLGAAARTRPVQVTRPMTDQLERDFAEHPHPLPPTSQVPAVRRVPDVAPHRMTHEQRQEQQQLNRQRPAAQFPTSVTLGARGPMVRGPGAPGAQVIGRARPVTSSQEDILRSPQRTQPDHHPVLEPRRFQLKVTDTSYSTPIPKVSDQLPAQITEDPPEPQDPTTSAAAQSSDPTSSGTQEPASSSQPTPSQEVSSPTRASRTSPMKSHGGQKPTPPHRMTQEEKSLRFALATEKEKPPAQSSLPTTSASSQQQQTSSLAHRSAGHQDDTLAVVQSVFESKPRGPDTPKDKEAISKIADLLRNSADEFTTQSSVVDGSRQRTLSGGPPRVPPFQMDGQHPQHQLHHSLQQHPLRNDQLGEDPRRKRNSSARYDVNSMQNSQNMPQHQMPQQQMEPPHRPRGRPRGSTVSQRNRFPSGQEPVAPHRAAGGARTLPPRAQEPPQPASRNAATKNSDSESDGVGDVGEEVGDWTMRCHCGMTHGDGPCVECEKCQTWQHMACMGMKATADTSTYLCEMCQPRRLRVTKAEAIRAQKKFLADQAARKKGKRKSDTTDNKKSNATGHPTGRKSAPMALHPQPTTVRLAQLNDYSKQASALLIAMPQTAGADTLLEESRLQHRARRMFVAENVEGLVTTQDVLIRQVILEVNGHVSMATEVKRKPGGGNSVFMYDGLMKGTAGEDMGDKQELVCVDAKRKGNDTKFTRRSCLPNCVLKHVLGSNATLGIMVVATKDIPQNQEVTLPFDADWSNSDHPLECAEHMKEMESCPFENERRRAADERFQAKERVKRENEKLKRAEEEKRLLEEEVKKERAKKVKELEQAEKERLEQEEQEAKEREKSKKKKKTPEKKEESVATSSTTESLEMTSREERHIRQAEEMFRRQEEEEKRKEAKKERRSKTPSVADETPAARRQSNRHQKTDNDVPSTSDATPSTSASSTRRSTKRTESVWTRSSPTPTLPAKRTRASTVKVSSTQNSLKRPTTAATTPVAKRAKPSGSGTMKDFSEFLRSNANMCIKQPPIDYSLPTYIVKDAEPVSDWVLGMKDVDRSEDDKQIKKEKNKKREDEKQKHQKEIKKVQIDRKEKEKHLADKKKAFSEKKKIEELRKKESVKKVQEAVQQPAEAEAAQPAPVEEESRGASEETTVSEELGIGTKSEGAVGIERGASEETPVEKETVEKEPVPQERKKGPKTISLEEYTKRCGSRKEKGEGSSGPPATRKGFIPSTEGSSLANVQLSDIYLESEPSISAPTTTTISHAGVPVASIGTNVVSSPNTRSRTRGALSESVDETPTDHNISLRDRAGLIFDLRLGSSSTAASTPPVRANEIPNNSSGQNSNTRRSRQSRWNQQV